MFNTLASQVCQLGWRIVNTYRNNEAEIKIFGGIALMAAGAVSAAMAAPKAQEVLALAEDNMNMVHRAEELPEDIYSQKDATVDKVKVVAQTGLKLAKTFAPAIVCEVGGASLIVSGYKCMSGRIIGLAAAYKALDEAYANYRKRVVAVEGPEADRAYESGIAVSKKTLKNKKGETAVVETRVIDTANGCGSPYARFVDHIPGRELYNDDPGAIRHFIFGVLESANSLLRVRKKLYLNDVYHMLGLEETEAGHEVGWLYRPGDPNHNGDNNIDFGLNDVLNERFMEGLEQVAFLDFNVDGIITPKAYERKI